MENWDKKKAMPKGQPGLGELRVQRREGARLGSSGARWRRDEAKVKREGIK